MDELLKQLAGKIDDVKYDIRSMRKDLHFHETQVEVSKAKIEVLEETLGSLVEIQKLWTGKQ